VVILKFAICIYVYFVFIVIKLLFEGVISLSQFLIVLKIKKGSIFKTLFN
jgi:hypothetical protein